MITYTHWKAEESLITEAVGLLCESSKTDSLEHLMLQAQQGRQDIRDELANLLSNYIKGILRNLSRSNPFANTHFDDIAQESLIKIFRNLDGQLGSEFAPGSTSAWITRIVRNTMSDMGRKEKRMPNTTNDDVEKFIGKEDKNIEKRELAERIRDAISRLSKRDQEIIKASYFMGKRYKDIADQLGIPVGTVKSRLHSAKTRFRSIANRMHLQTT